MDANQLKNRTKVFSIAILELVEKLPNTISGRAVANQIVRSGTSVGANYRAVCRGKSTSDFLNKLKIVDEEADESLFWLEFIQGLEIDCDKNELERLIKEANELVSIFSAGIKTIKQKNNLK